MMYMEMEVKVLVGICFVTSSEELPEVSSLTAPIFCPLTRSIDLCSLYQAEVLH